MGKGRHWVLVVSLTRRRQRRFSSDIHYTGPIVRQRRMSRTQQPGLADLITIASIGRQ